jgi:radical SAM protein with 4Fe4S-binding SPASM domain
MCWAYKAGAHRRKTFLAYEEYTKIIDDIEPFCSKIFFSFCGEPLLNRDIFRMIKYANEKNMIVGLSTNAMLLTKQNAIRLLEAAPYEVIISLDAADKMEYESMRVGGDFDEVINKVRFLTEEKKRRLIRAPSVIMQMILTKRNEDQIDDFINLSKDIDADSVVVKSLFIDHHGDPDYINKLSNEYLTDHYVSRYSRNNGGRIVLKEAGLCPNNSSPVISSDGEVYICCFDIFGEHRQGSMLNDTFCSIWNSHAYRKFREVDMLRRKLPLCRVCVYSNVPELNISLKN